MQCLLIFPLNVKYGTNLKLKDLNTTAFIDNASVKVINNELGWEDNLTKNKPREQYTIILNSIDNFTSGLNFLALLIEEDKYESYALSLTIAIGLRGTNHSLIINGTDITETPSYTLTVGYSLNVTFKYYDILDKFYITNANVSAVGGGINVTLDENIPLKQYSAVIKAADFNSATNFVTIYALRANGIGATSDYTPHWANTGNNHAWNVIIMPDGKATPIMGNDSDPSRYKLSSKAAKVYRKVFSEQKDNLAFKLMNNEKAPAWLSGKCYKDVTHEYTKVFDVNITLDCEIPDSTNYLYLCVFNSGEWRAIHWGKIDNKAADFTDMGVDIAYLPMFYVDEKLFPAANPFILTKNGDKKFLNGNNLFEEEVVLRSVIKKNIDRSKKDGRTVFLEVGEKYELFYWEDGWESFGTQIATESPLKFIKLPAKRLYWLVKENSDEEERIFTYDNNKQIWW